MDVEVLSSSLHLSSCGSPKTGIFPISLSPEKEVCAFAGINYSSPILAAAMGNLIPGLTFVFAIIFRDQKKPGLGGIDFPPPLFLTSRSFKGGLFKILMDEFSHET
ncbi:hypothetical protein LguiA_020673 [Lonicera macranthoides]